VLTFAGVLAVLAGAVLAVSAALKVYNMVAKIMAIVSRAAWLSALGPIGLVIAAIALVIGIVVVMYKKFDWFRRFVDKVWALVKRGAQLAFGFIKSYAKLVFAAITIYVRVWMTIAKAVFTVVKVVARAAFAAIAAVVRWAGKVFSSVFTSIRSKATAMWTALKAGARAAFTAVVASVQWARDKISAVWTAIKDGARSAFSAVVVSVQWARDKIAGIVSGIKSGWNSAFASMSAKVGRVMTAAKGPIDKVTAAVERIISAIRRLLDWIGKIKFPSPPAWVSKLPGLGKAAPAGTSAGVTATGVGPGLRAGGRAVSTGGGGVTINVSGALDPAAVAVQIRRILRDDDRRRGRVIPGGGTVGGLA